MDVRDALAASIEFCSKEQRQAEADYIIRRLAAKGYRIVSGLDPETLEAAAGVAERYEHRTSRFQVDSIPWFAAGVAAAIRSMKGGGDGE